MVPESGIFDLPFQHQDLLPQSQVFELQVTLGTQEDPEVVENDVKHCIVFG